MPDMLALGVGMYTRVQGRDALSSRLHALGRRGRPERPGPGSADAVMSSNVSKAGDIGEVCMCEVGMSCEPSAMGPPCWGDR